MRSHRTTSPRSALPAWMPGLLLACAAIPALATAQGGILYTFDGHGSTVTRGDLNRDGYADVIVSGGGVTVYSGKDGRVLMRLSPKGGGAAVLVGDVNADGWPDLLVSGIGLPRRPGVIWGGGAYVYSGKDGSLLRLLEEYGAMLGRSVAAAGDVNGDGVPDLLVGAHIPGPGLVFLYSGKDFRRLYSRRGPNDGAWFGQSVCSADLNGDKVPDLIVGEPGGNTRKIPGAVHAISGKDFKVLYTIPGRKPREFFGYSVAVAGDVDKDGTPDLIVGAPYQDRGLSLNRGAARVLSGKTGRTIFTLRSDLLSNRLWQNFGWSVSGAGDVNGDGWPDLLVGAGGPYSNYPPAYLFSGRTGKLLCRFTGTGVRDTDFGYSVAGGGDVNRDGRPDLISSEPRANGGRGRVWVFSGRGPAATSAFGKGCPAGRPLVLAYSGAPRLAKTLSVNLSNGPASPTAGAIFLGVDNRAPYPIDLTFLGMPGCLLHHSADMVFPVNLTGGRTTQGIPIPDDGSLCRGSFFNQGAALDRGANALGVSASNAGKATIGW